MEGGPTGPITLAGNGEFQADPPLGKVTMDFSAISGGALGGKVIVIMDGPDMYMQMPGLSAGTTKSWFKIDTETLGAAPDSDSSPRSRRATRRRRSSTCSGATEDVEEAGTEEIRGVETTKYTMTIDLNKAAEQARAEELKQSILETIEADGRERSAGRGVDRRRRSRPQDGHDVRRDHDRRGHDEHDGHAGDLRFRRRREHRGPGRRRGARLRRPRRADSRPRRAQQ